jgi:TonB family protein
VVSQVQTDSGPDLLLHWQDRPDSRTFVRDGIGSLVVHAVVIGFALLLASIPTSPTRVPEFRIDLKKAIPLVAPRLQQLTQKDPNTGEVAKEVNLEALLARPTVAPHIPQPPRVFQAPAQQASPPPPAKQPQLLPEPPKIDALVKPPANAPQFGTPEAPPPKAQSPEPPKLAFEMPGQNGPTVQRLPGMPRIAPPKMSVDDAIRDVVHGAGQGGGISVGDEDQLPSIADPLHQRPSPGTPQSSVQLMSDAQGVDFKPYLIRILATVKRNWLAIIPESARLGRHGKVLLQFIVDKDGSVPKLVIAMPSGTEAFDKAAVAGISASVPFPPLPAEFKGSEVRLQFAFVYNMR